MPPPAAESDGEGFCHTDEDVRDMVFGRVQKMLDWARDRLDGTLYQMGCCETCSGSGLMVMRRRMHVCMCQQSSYSTGCLALLCCFPKSTCYAYSSKVAH